MDNAPKPKTALARKFRKSLTVPEYLLWQRLKERHDTLTFRRQHPLGPYILDFYCPKAKLAIEVDGHEHGLAGHHERDLIRDKWFAEKGIETYRVPAAEVFRNVDTVADGIRLKALERLQFRKDTPPPRP
ncbi:endonuclease domain-containing protein [Asticcacaulis endophyticus]|uniref:DUF559 domain-containing protein n=1 Tax=Asticcacaulis endophyticus TaxID=1395890 RepID=A0A918QDG2_9CAUL|nr:DUF559 domain-containing protein [Asticcacaulis endophyticus]GGZ41988.1 hypothetical protein GCM10011273_30940 [Asticcacaulis endophyticus]